MIQKGHASILPDMAFSWPLFLNKNAVDGVPIRQRRRLSCRFYLSLFIIYLN
ncbi:hypothetical protein HMPREF3038_00409 [Akkermansia sp. KLE1797]|nr:hypothetical protein HMPREF3038_00409 [Akkermansia sp. KLE1797]KXU54998.1 hypothetical protein HMPREF3039_00723 [Akkermansia sp. KLE1798]KZA04372.1 hypothetical protein HMPREF1326_02040 [Akkermansia sp. KLE1605]